MITVVDARPVVAPILVVPLMPAVTMGGGPRRRIGKGGRLRAEQGKGPCGGNQQSTHCIGHNALQVANSTGTP